MSQRPTPLVTRIAPRGGLALLHLGELLHYRDVLGMIALRDLKLRYRQTLLGVVWVVLQPLAAGLLFSLVFGRFARLPADGGDYLLFVFSGLMIWGLVSGVIQRAGNSLVSEARLITKVYFPRVIIPLAAALSALVDFAVSSLVLAGLLVWRGAVPGVSIVWIPVAVVLALTLAVGLSLWISALNVRYRDFGHALPFLLQVWMYGSPVVYALSLIPADWQLWFQLNPMCGVLGLFRHALLGGDVPTATAWCAAGGAALLFLISGAFYFRSVEQEFAERL